MRRFFLQDHFEQLFDSPRTVAINAVPQCNYRCGKCQYHSPHANRGNRFGSPMPLDRFLLLLEKCKDYPRLASISPTISGEPLLHPQIDRIVRAIKDAGYACGFATNASLLDGNMSRRLLDAGVDELAFSVDAATPETYRLLQGGDLRAVERNILAFQRESLRSRGDFHGSMVFVVSSENIHEMGEYRKRWLDRGFRVHFSAEHQITADATPFFADMRWAPKQRMPCFSAFLGLYLSVEGRVLTCGATAGFRGFKESLFDHAPADLWRCHALRHLREMQLRDGAPRYCKNFSCWTGLMTTWLHKNQRLLCRTQGSIVEVPDASITPRNVLSRMMAWSKRRVRHVLRRIRRGLRLAPSL